MIGNLITTLETFPLSNTCTIDNIETARKRFTSLFAPHQIEVAERERSLNAYVSYSIVDEGVSLVYERFGYNICFKPQTNTDFFALTIPIRGESTLIVYDQEIACNPKQGTIISPHVNSHMTCYAEFEALVVRIERAKIERCLEQQLGRFLTTPLKFSPAVPLTSIKANEISNLLSFITVSLANGTGISSSKVVRINMESLLLNSLLTSLDHNYYRDVIDSPVNVLPAYIRKAQNFIHANLHLHIQPEEIASLACVSTRTLYTGFKEYLSTTPMRYLKELRLTQVYKRLLAAESRHVSITSTAYEHGFNHLGHFGTAYKKKFGETPTETLNHSSVEN